MNEKEIIAIEKQQPMKVMWGHHCPRCECGLPTESITDPYYKEICRCCFDPKYCPNCGQALDWNI